jgi:hypothetical protein
MAVVLAEADEGAMRQSDGVKILSLRASRREEQLLRGPEIHRSARVKRIWLPSNMWDALLAHTLRPTTSGRSHNFLSRFSLSKFVLGLVCRFSAYRSFCQQRKEELAIVCSFSGEGAATRACQDCVTEGCVMVFRE